MAGRRGVWGESRLPAGSFHRKLDGQQAHLSIQLFLFNQPTHAPCIDDIRWCRARGFSLLSGEGTETLMNRRAAHERKGTAGTQINVEEKDPFHGPSGYHFPRLRYEM